jgi:hypothetical protein
MIGYAPSLQDDSREVASPPNIAAALAPTAAPSGMKTLRILSSDTGERWIARRFDEALAELLRERATVAPADVSPRPRKERQTWRSEEEESGSSDPIPLENSGESSWSDGEAREIVASIRRKRKRGR